MVGDFLETNLAAYQQMATGELVAESDSHHLTAMLMDGALARMRLGKICIEGGLIKEKAAVLQHVVEIIDELRLRLDHPADGRIATDMERLYEYMAHRVVSANLNNDRACLDEVIGMLSDIRAAWVAISPALRTRKKQD